MNYTIPTCISNIINIERCLFFPQPECDVAEDDKEGDPDGGGDEAEVHRRPRDVPTAQHYVPHGLR